MTERHEPEKLTWEAQQPTLNTGGNFSMPGNGDTPEGPPRHTDQERREHDAESKALRERYKDRDEKVSEVKGRRAKGLVGQIVDNLNEEGKIKGLPQHEIESLFEKLYREGKKDPETMESILPYLNKLSVAMAESSVQKNADITEEQKEELRAQGGQKLGDIMDEIEYEDRERRVEEARRKREATEGNKRDKGKSTEQLLEEEDGGSGGNKPPYRYDDDEEEDDDDEEENGKKKKKGGFMARIERLLKGMFQQNERLLKESDRHFSNVEHLLKEGNLQREELIDLQKKSNEFLFSISQRLDLQEYERTYQQGRKLDDLLTAQEAATYKELGVSNFGEYLNLMLYDIAHYSPENSSRYKQVGYRKEIDAYGKEVRIPKYAKMAGRRWDDEREVKLQFKALQQYIGAVLRSTEGINPALAMSEEKREEFQLLSQNYFTEHVDDLNVTEIQEAARRLSREGDLNLAKYYENYTPEGLEGRRGYGELPNSLHDLMRAVMDNAEKEYFTGQKKEIVDKNGEIHFENFLDWVRTRAVEQEDNNPDGFIDTLTKIDIRVGISTISLMDMILMPRFLQDRDLTISGNDTDSAENITARNTPTPNPNWDTFRWNVLLEAWLFGTDHNNATNWRQNRGNDKALFEKIPEMYGNPIWTKETGKGRSSRIIQLMKLSNRTATEFQSFQDREEQGSVGKAIQIQYAAYRRLGELANIDAKKSRYSKTGDGELNMFFRTLANGESWDRNIPGTEFKNWHRMRAFWDSLAAQTLDTKKDARWRYARFVDAALSQELANATQGIEDTHRLQAIQRAYQELIGDTEEAITGDDGRIVIDPLTGEQVKIKNKLSNSYKDMTKQFIHLDSLDQLRDFKIRIAEIKEYDGKRRIVKTDEQALLSLDRDMHNLDQQIQKDQQSLSSAQSQDERERLQRRIARLQNKRDDTSSDKQERIRMNTILKNIDDDVRHQVRRTIKDEYLDKLDGLEGDWQKRVDDETAVHVTTNTKQTLKTEDIALFDKESSVNGEQVQDNREFALRVFQKVAGYKQSSLNIFASNDNPYELSKIVAQAVADGASFGLELEENEKDYAKRIARNFTNWTMIEAWNDTTRAGFDAYAKRINWGWYIEKQLKNGHPANPQMIALFKHTGLSFPDWLRAREEGPRANLTAVESVEEKRKKTPFGVIEKNKENWEDYPGEVGDQDWDKTLWEVIQGGQGEEVNVGNLGATIIKNPEGAEKHFGEVYVQQMNNLYSAITTDKYIHWDGNLHYNQRGKVVAGEKLVEQLWETWWKGDRYMFHTPLHMDHVDRTYVFEDDGKGDIKAKFVTLKRDEAMFGDPVLKFKQEGYDGNDPEQYRKSLMTAIIWADLVARRRGDEEVKFSEDMFDLIFMYLRTKETGVVPKFDEKGNYIGEVELHGPFLNAKQVGLLRRMAKLDYLHFGITNDAVALAAGGLVFTGGVLKGILKEIVRPTPSGGGGHH